MTAAFTNPIHLYRSLLRETTYLFDQNARSYFQQYVASAFRTQSSNFKLKLEGQSKCEVEHLPSLEERHQLRRGRKLLSTLQRANQGYIKPLENVLKRTYGRKGRRRRDLMAEYMLKEPMENKGVKAGTEGKPINQHEERRVKEFGKGWKPPSKFAALMRSQDTLQRYLDHGPKIRVKPVIEEKNAWGKPMPECRIRNATKAWYAKTAQVLLPHLSEKEYEDIKERASGKYTTIPKRRSAATAKVSMGGEENAGSKASDDLAAVLINGPAHQQSVQLRVALGNPHQLKPRFLRRMYTRAILKHTPIVVAKSSGAGVVYKWDCGNLKTIKSTKVVDKDHAALLFAPIKKWDLV